LQITFYGSETFQNKAAKPWLRFAKVPPQIHDFRAVLQPSQCVVPAGLNRQADVVAAEQCASKARGVEHLVHGA
jgi:hypothetical protein